MPDPEDVAFEPTLADLLVLTASCLGENGHPGEGRDAAEEAVALYRSLVERDPDRFAEQFDRALATLRRLDG